MNGNRLRRTISLLTAVVVLLVSGCAQALLKPNAPEGSDYYRGYMDGLEQAEVRSGETTWGVGSFLGTLACCLIGVGVSTLANSSSANPPPEFIIGKSSEYVSGFTSAFQARARQKRQASASTGLGVGILCNVVVNLIVLPTLFQ